MREEIIHRLEYGRSVPKAVRFALEKIHLKAVCAVTGRDLVGCVSGPWVYRDGSGFSPPGHDVLDAAPIEP